MGGLDTNTERDKVTRLAAYQVFFVISRNMAWKLRNLEREKYGRSVFLSPNTSKLSLAGSSSRFHSPKSPNLYEH